MIRGLALAALIALPAGAQTPAERSRTVFAERRWGDGWFLCDAINAPAVVAVSRPAGGGASITVVTKSGAAPVVTKFYRVGRADPGAGQVHYALFRGGREAGAIHAFNPGMAADPAAALTPPITGMRLGSADYECRWMQGTRLLAVTARRTIQVRATKAGLVYESFDFAATPRIVHPDGVQRSTVPTQRVAGGRELVDGRGGSVLRFANAGYTYELRVPRAGPAGILVARGGRIVQRDLFAGYTFAPAR